MNRTMCEYSIDTLIQRRFETEKATAVLAQYSFGLTAFSEFEGNTLIVRSPYQ